MSFGGYSVKGCCKSLSFQKENGRGLAQKARGKIKTKKTKKKKKRKKKKKKKEVLKPSRAAALDFCQTYGQRLLTRTTKRIASDNIPAQ